MKEERTPHNSLLWKIRIPCKIKIFLWYIQKGVLLTKDNLVKRKWKGDTACCFCSCNEDIQHLFFECHLAKSIWNTISIAFNVRIPVSFADLFGDWLRCWTKNNRRLVCVGLSAMCWAIWLSRNDIVFKKTTPNSFLQVLFRGTYWTRTWAKLSKEEEMNNLKQQCSKLEIAVMEIFNKFGWKNRNRLQD
ncbi:unnamed protein product [Urochloa decumbens]|uniref:Reverse transcriptase zinc-binding domain-containing protein n=1 Tax=Urochloa decumbens TaxID=240449 RepID=A0ABC8X151_9POAL